jgi:hypothetical protein
MGIYEGSAARTTSVFTIKLVGSPRPELIDVEQPLLSLPIGR